MQKPVILNLIACCAAWNVASLADEARPQRPNFVIILADDMGYSDAGCYGGEISTPNLDALATNGLRFTQFYNTARCWPTRGALLTGYYAQAIRRDAIPGTKGGAQGKRPAWAPLLPAMLKPLGYRAYHSGKWHVDGAPLAGGFDRAYTLDDHNRLFSPQQHTNDDKPLPAVKKGDDYYASTAIADHAIECLKEHAAKHSGEPLFSYVAFTAPHFPLQAPAEDIARYRDRYAAGWDEIQAQRGKRLRELGIVTHDPPPMERDLGPPYEFPKAREALGPGEVFRPLPWKELTDEQRAFQAQKMAIHAGMVDRMDREIGRIVAQLKDMNALENTLILFASDNGASAEIMVRGDGHDQKAAPGSAATFLCLGPGWSSAANTPLRRHKTWVHEGGIATPLIAHWPAGIKARGELRHDATHVIDIVPTVLELAGGERPKEWNGKPAPPPPGLSLVPAFARSDSVQHEELWWFHDGHRALRMGDWKLVSARPSNQWELYNLATDRGETNDRAAAQPERVRKMATRWQERLDAMAALADREDGASAP
jgi:arylsulfatase